MNNVELRRLPGNEDLSLPKQMSAGAAGFDLTAAVLQPTTIEPGKWRLIPTGISIAMPNGLEAQVRPRSGLALKYGITVLNTPGTIDADYRGEIGVILLNLGEQAFEVQRGERIAQLVFQQVASVKLQEVKVLDDTQRGAGGFGHTGKS
ncbi:dUTP diphosphatase [Risungbinella massiliensis]|uniref:dUTP diphosphatase n=1 Tax=Risungbinella massiliensis TaxID=1329796 RepID=UPI0005CB8393|nr:dUTP diphosphatase [Risungbinella massiliensis]